MKIDVKNNRKHKYIFYGICLAVTGLMLSMSYNDYFGNQAPSANQASQPVQSASATDSRQTEQAASDFKHHAIASIVPDDSRNPFIESSGLKLLDTKAVQGNPPQAAVSLPNIPRPSIPRVYMPPSANSFNAQAPAIAPPAPPQAEIKGVMTSEDGGAMAIMSDGTILSEGDTYNDGRIAYIGGTGITFDNGSNILFK